MQLTVGFALAKPAEVLGAEPYVHELVSGIERVLIPRGGSLLLRIVHDAAEVAATIRRWADAGLVDALILIDLEPHDPVVSLVRELGIPAVVAGDPESASGLPAVWAQDDLAMETAVRAMLELGHTRIAHLTGPGHLAHTRLRMAVFEREVTAGGGVPLRGEGDYTERSGREGALELLGSSRPPTAIIADNDLMAIGALDAAREGGIPVPAGLSVLAWDDSAQCQLARPPLSAMSHDIQALGELLALTLIDRTGEGADAVRAPRAELVTRGSTGPAPGNLHVSDQ